MDINESDSKHTAQSFPRLFEELFTRGGIVSEVGQVDVRCDMSVCLTVCLSVAGSSSSEVDGPGDHL